MESMRHGELLHSDCFRFYHRLWIASFWCKYHTIFSQWSLMDAFEHLSQSFSKPQNYLGLRKKVGVSWYQWQVSRVSRTRINISQSILRAGREGWKSEDPFSVPIPTRFFSPLCQRIFLTFHRLWTVSSSFLSREKYIMTSANLWVQTWTWHN